MFLFHKTSHTRLTLNHATCVRSDDSQLLKDPQVLFAGYKHPHPLEHKIVLRVQTTSDYSPQEAVTNAVTDLISEVSLLEERFKVRHVAVGTQGRPADPLEARGKWKGEGRRR